jgi:predicted DNA-binding transcriptional regulator AlpA
MFFIGGKGQILYAKGDTRTMPKPADALHQTAAVVSMEILTPQQLAERLQVKPSWIYEQTRNRSGVRNPDPLPHIKMGLYLRFDWRDVLEWLERQKNLRN